MLVLQVPVALLTEDAKGDNFRDFLYTKVVYSERKEFAPQEQILSYMSRQQAS